MPNEQTESALSNPVEAPKVEAIGEALLKSFGRFAEKGNPTERAGQILGSALRERIEAEEAASLPPLEIGESQSKGLELLTRQRTRFEQEGAIRVAHILSRQSDFGNRHQQDIIQGIFHDAIMYGPLSVERLTNNINHELRKDGSDVQLASQYEVLAVKFAQNLVNKSIIPAVHTVSIPVVRLEVSSEGFVHDVIYSDAVPQPYNSSEWVRIPHAKESLPEPEMTEMELARERRRVEAEGALQIVHILKRQGHFGSKYQHGIIQDLFQDAIDLGPDSINRLTDNINQELEKQGSDMHLAGHLKVLAIRFVEKAENQQSLPPVHIVDVPVLRLEVSTPGYVEDVLYTDSVPRPYDQPKWRRLPPARARGN